MPHTAGVGLSGRGLLLRAITVKQFNTGIYKASQQKPIKRAAKWGAAGNVWKTLKDDIVLNAAGVSVTHLT